MEPKINNDAAIRNEGSSTKFFNICRLLEELGTEDQCLQFAISRGLIPTEKFCRSHRIRMELDRSETIFGSFRCRECGGDSSISRANDTWFADVKISLVRAFYLSYCFAHHVTYEFAIREYFVMDEERLTEETVFDWYSFCKEAVVEYQAQKVTSTRKLGGPGKVVQIYKCKFPKKQYNRCRHIEGHWLVGLIEDGTDDLRLEVCSDSIISAQFLLPVIKKHVAEGTIVHTDDCKAYDCLNRYGYIRVIDDQSEANSSFAYFGANGKRILTPWKAVRRFIKSENYSDLKDIVLEYYWRRDIKKTNKDAFNEFLLCIENVYHPSIA